MIRKYLSKRVVIFAFILITIIVLGLSFYFRSSYKANELTPAQSVIYLSAKVGDQRVSGVATIQATNQCNEASVVFSVGFTQCTLNGNTGVYGISFNDLNTSTNYSVRLSPPSYHQEAVKLTAQEYYLHITISEDKAVTVKQLINGQLTDITETGIIP